MATKTRKDPSSNASFTSITAATKWFSDNGFKMTKNVIESIVISCGGVWGWRGKRGRVYMCTLCAVILPGDFKFASYWPA